MPINLPNEKPNLVTYVVVSTQHKIVNADRSQVVPSGWGEIGPQTEVETVHSDMADMAHFDVIGSTASSTILISLKASFISVTNFVLILTGTVYILYFHIKF